MEQKLTNRKSIRLKYYDYSLSGLYFITACTHNKLCLFGEIDNDEMFKNKAGLMVESSWNDLATRFSNIQLHEYVIMPNHFHGIIEITNKNNPLGDIIGAFKSIVTNAY